MSVANDVDWGRTAETAVRERWPLEYVAGDNSEPDWFDARTITPIKDGDLP